MPVKAAEVRSHVDRMRLLADKVWTSQPICLTKPHSTLPVWTTSPGVCKFKLVCLLEHMHPQQHVYRHQQPGLLRPLLSCTQLSTYGYADMWGC